MPFAEGICNDCLESWIRRRASRAARFDRLKSLKKGGDTANNGQTRENTFKLFEKWYKIHPKCYQNARREWNGAQRAPRGGAGSEESPTKVQKGRQMELTAPQRNPKGPKRTTKMLSNDTKICSKCNPRPCWKKSPKIMSLGQPRCSQNAKKQTKIHPKKHPTPNFVEP